MKISMNRVSVVATFFTISLPVVAVTCWVNVDPVPCPPSAPIGDGGWYCNGILTPSGQTYPWVSSATTGWTSTYVLDPACHYACTATNESGFTRSLSQDYFAGARTTGTSCNGGTL